MSLNNIAGQTGGATAFFGPANLDPTKLKEIQQKLLENGGKVPEIDTSKIDHKKFLDQFTKDFGNAAAESIKDKDGKIDFKKVKNFFDDKLAASSSEGLRIRAEPGSQASNESQQTDPTKALIDLLNSSFKNNASKKVDAKKLLEQFTKDFGNKATDSIKDKDGNLDLDKLKSFFESQLAKKDAGGQPVFGPPPADEQTNKTKEADAINALIKLLNGDTKDAKTKSLADLIFGNKDDDTKEEKDTGRYLNVST
jgi:hypothetical protein